MILEAMKTKNNENHFYILPSGEIVANQKEACIKLGIGRNAFRNRVKSGLIEKIAQTNSPKGYEKQTCSTLR